MLSDAEKELKRYAKIIFVWGAIVAILIFIAGCVCVNKFPIIKPYEYISGFRTEPNWAWFWAGLILGLFEFGGSYILSLFVYARGEDFAEAKKIRRTLEIGFAKEIAEAKAEEERQADILRREEEARKEKEKQEKEEREKARQARITAFWERYQAAMEVLTEMRTDAEAMLKEHKGLTGGQRKFLNKTIREIGEELTCDRPNLPISEEETVSIERLLNLDFTAELARIKRKTRRSQAVCAVTTVLVFALLGYTGYIAYQKEHSELYQGVLNSDSLLITYELLQDLPKEYWDREMKNRQELCEKFLLYCGDFEVIGSVYKLESDFIVDADSGMLMWDVTPLLGSKMSVEIQSTTSVGQSRFHTFFSKPSVVDQNNLEISESWEGYTAAISFRDGDIFYRLTYNGETIKSRHYTKTK